MTAIRTVLPMKLVLRRILILLRLILILILQKIPIIKQILIPIIIPLINNRCTTAGGVLDVRGGGLGPARGHILIIIITNT